MLKMIHRHLTPMFSMQAACFTVKNIQTAQSFPRTVTPVVYVTVTEGRLSAQRHPVTETAATLINPQDNAAENVNVCKGKIKLCPMCSS